MRELVLKLMQDRQINVPETVLQHYVELGLDSDEFIIFLHLSNGEHDLRTVAKSMGLEHNELISRLQRLMDKHLVIMEQVLLPDGKIDLQYSFAPLYEKVVTLLMKMTQKAVKTENVHHVSDVVEAFQQEFGRVLTPTELAIIRDWVVVDQFKEELIMAALKEAVLAQARNLKYIQAILDNWRQKNIQSIHEAEKESLNYRQKKVAPITSASVSSAFSDEALEWFRQ